MILKTVLSDKGFVNLVNFLASQQNELWASMFLSQADGESEEGSADILLLAISDIKPVQDGLILKYRAVDKGDKVKITRIVNHNAIRVVKENGSFGQAHNVVLEIGQKLFLQKFAPFGEETPRPERLHVEMSTIMDCIQSLFEIICQFQVKEKKV